MVEATIDMNLTENHEYVIKPSFDEKLTGRYVNALTLAAGIVYKLLSPHLITGIEMQGFFYLIRM